MSNRTRNFSIENLEQRELMAAGIDFVRSTGVLTITGDRFSDAAFVEFEADEVNVRLESTEADGDIDVDRRDEDIEDVRQIIFKSLGGNDKFVIRELQLDDGVSLSGIRLSFNAGAGDDSLENNSSVPIVAFGKSGDDTLKGGWGHDRILGGTDNDKLYGGSGNDRMFGGLGIDQIYGGFGNDYLYGDLGNNYYFIGDSDYLYGGAGRDRIFGQGGWDLIRGDYVPNSFEHLFGGRDIIYGGNGVDTVYGDAGNDVIYGGNDGDYLFGDSGNDRIYGQSGNDTIEGNIGNDRLYGGIGADKIYGNEDNDYLEGQDGKDFLSGQQGNDTLIGGTVKRDSSGRAIRNGDNDGDVDELWGGTGSDKYEMDARKRAWYWGGGYYNRDIVKDFWSYDGDRIINWY